MKNLMQETGKTVRKVWAVKIWRVILALVLVAGLASAAYFPAKQVLADSKSNSADVIFTKWVTTGTDPPVKPVDMAGVVSGDCGAGLFVGKVSNMDTVGNISTITADYGFNGGAHQFKASVTVTQDNTTGTAVITGVVTQSAGNWMLGAEVTGSYQANGASGIINTNSGPFPGYCFQGTLHLKKGH